MNFENNHALAQQVDSIEVYVFTTSTTTYRYTSHERDVVIGGNTYTAAPINRSGFTRDVNLRVATCQVRAPITTFFQQYIAATPIIPVQVEIRKYFTTDLVHCQYVFKGKITNCTIKGQMAEVECVSMGYELKERIPHVFYQSYCNNVLYGDVCGLNREEWDFDTTLIALSADGKEMEIDHTWFIPTGFLSLGTVTFNGDKRMITSHDSNYVFTIHFPLSGLVVGSSINITLGCNKSPETCVTRFANLDNFIGFPYIPLGKNPTQKPV